MEIRRRILIIDDDPALISALTETVRCRLPDVIVDGRPSVTSAIVALQTVHYDLVVCDLRMPREDGLTFLDTIKPLPHRPPVILITGAIEESIAKEASRRGATAVLPKPLDRTRFCEVVRSALGDDTWKAG